MKVFVQSTRRGGRAAFTLVEMVMAVAILSIIMLGMQSAILLASRAVPNQANASSAALTAGSAIDRLSADLAYASSITTSTANTIEFSVPDRTGDGAADTIRYSWSGVSGAPLLRTINGTATAIATNIREFALTYDKRSQARAATATESGEIILSYYDGAGLLNLGNFEINSNDWCGQCFTPSLPNGATEWRVTRVKFKASERSSNDGVARVQIRAASGTSPGVILEETTMSEATLSSAFAWKEFAFSSVSGRTPGSGIALVIAYKSGGEACDIQYQTLLAGAANANFVKTTNGGSSWTAPAGQDMPYYVYGTYSTADPVVTDYWLTAVRCTLRSGTDTGGRVRTTIRVLNEPQVSGP